MMRRLVQIFLCCVGAVACQRDLELFEGRLLELSSGIDWNTVSIGHASNEVWIAGGIRYYAGNLAHSLDNGATWQETELSNKAFLGSHVAHDGALWLCGIDGTLWRYTQAVGWSMLRNYLYPSLEAVTTLFQPTDVAVCGGGNFKNGFVARFDNLGALDVQRDTFEMEFGAIARTDSAVVIGGYGTIHRSTDTAQTWLHVYTPDDHITRLAVDGRQHIWALGLSGSVHRSNDHGAHWTRMTRGEWVRGSVYAAFAVSPDGEKLVRATADGQVAISRNGGRNWSFGRIDGLPHARWRSAAANNTHFYLVGNSGAAAVVIW